MALQPSPPVHPPPEGLNPVIDRNIHALLERERRIESGRGLQDRMADRVTRFTGSLTFVYIHVVVFGLWILINTGWLPLPRFDPTLVVLAMVASVEAIFLTSFVLITQNRMAAVAEKRAELGLQISLLAEHEVTRLIALARAMGRKLGVEESCDPELAELQQDIAPEQVLDHIEAERPADARPRVTALRKVLDRWTRPASTR